jgi:hypothetical protein
VPLEQSSLIWSSPIGLNFGEKKIQKKSKNIQKETEATNSE